MLNHFSSNERLGPELSVSAQRKSGPDSRLALSPAHVEDHRVRQTKVSGQADLLLGRHDQERSGTDLADVRSLSGAVCGTGRLELLAGAGKAVDRLRVGEIPKRFSELLDRHGLQRQPDTIIHDKIRSKFQYNSWNNFIRALNPLSLASLAVVLCSSQGKTFHLFLDYIIGLSSLLG